MFTLSPSLCDKTVTTERASSQRPERAIRAANLDIVFFRACQGRLFGRIAADSPTWKGRVPMELRDYLRAVRKRWWLVAGSIVVALGAAALGTTLTPPKYSASVTFFVGTQTKGVSDAYQGSLFSQQRIKSYADLLSRDRL